MEIPPHAPFNLPHHKPWQAANPTLDLVPPNRLGVYRKSDTGSGPLPVLRVNDNIDASME